MPYALKCWPESVYRKEVLDLPADIRAPVVEALRRLRTEGVRPVGYSCKPLGRSLRGIWQMNFKTERNEQMRLLYFAEGQEIVLLTVFKKTSEQEEQRAYELAKKRKREAEKAGDLDTIH